MSKIKCNAEGCSQVFETNEPVSSVVRFLCVKHTRVSAAERPKNLSLRWFAEHSDPLESSLELNIPGFVEDNYGEESFG